MYLYFAESHTPTHTLRFWFNKPTDITQVRLGQSSKSQPFGIDVCDITFL